MAENVQSYEELDRNLKEYTSQLKQVEELLLGDPENEELTDMYNSLSEVIQLTQDLLKDVRDQHAAGPGAASASEQAAAPSAGPSATLPGSQIITPPQLNLPAILPASVAEQIRKAQVRAAILGQSDPAWAIGAKCQAVYSADGQFYNALVEAVTVGGKFVVSFEGYTDKEEVDLAGIRPMPELTEVYQGVAAPKRKRVEDLPQVTEVPKWLEVNEEDNEKTKARKRKLLKSFKSKMRFQNMDLVQKTKQDSWQSFMHGKGSKKKTGFFTGAKKESIFKVPDNGKVGVVGSGKGLTEYAKTKKHQFSLDEQ